MALKEILMDKKELYARGLLTLIVLLMIVLRLVYFYQVRHYPGFAYYLPPDDQAYYHQTAQRIAGGFIMGEEGAIARGPGYVYFLGMIYRFSAHDTITALIIQWCLGVLTGVTIYFLARRLFGLGVALTAAAFYAFYLPAVCYEGALLMAALLTALLTTALYGLIRADQDRTSWPLILSGVLYGWAVLCRPNNLILLVLALVFLVWRHNGGRALFRLAVSAGVPYGFLLLRNYFAGGGLFSITTQGRQVLMNSHFHQATGVGWHWQDNWDSLLFEYGDGFWRFLGFLAGDIRRHWRDWLGLQFSKLYAFFFNYEYSQFVDFYSQQEVLSLLRLPSVSLGILSPLTLMGLVFLYLDRRQPYRLPLALYFLAGVASIVGFYVLSRFRLPLVPLFCVLGAYGLWRLPSSINRINLFGKAALAAGLAVTFYGLNADSIRKGYADLLMPTAIYNRAVHYSARGQYKQAAADFQRVYNRMGPDTDPSVYYLVAMNLANCYRRTARSEQAAFVWLDLTRKIPEQWQPYYFLGQHYAESGQYGQALMFLEQAVLRRPGDENLKSLVEKVRRQAGLAGALPSLPEKQKGRDLLT